MAAPQSSQVFGPGAYSWEDRDLAAREVLGHYEALVRDYPVDPGRVVLAGFSQGGSAPRDLDEARAAVERLGAGAPSGPVRFHLVVGDKDVVYERAVGFVEMLKAAGMAVRLDIPPGLGHDFPEDFGWRLQAGLTFLLG